MGIRIFISTFILLLMLNCTSGYVELHDPAKLPSTVESYDPSKTRMVEAEDCGSHILIFLPISINTRFKNAYRKLSNSLSFDESIIELSIEESWTYLFIGTKYCTTLRGKVARTKEAAAPVKK